MSSVDNLKKEAKRWLKAVRAGDENARARLRRTYPEAPAAPALRDIQQALAREHGFENWIACVAALERPADLDARLADAIAANEPDGLERLLRDHPDVLGNNRLWVRLLIRISGRSPARIVDRFLAVLRRHHSGLTIVNMFADQDMAPGGARRYTALHEAAAHGNVDAVRALLAHGADPRTRDTVRGRTPAGWARDAGHPGATELILDANVDIFDAIDADRGDIVGRIADRDPGAVDRPFGTYVSPGERPNDASMPAPASTPLEWAKATGKEHAIRALVDRGADRRTPEDVARAERIVTFLQSACWDHHAHGKGNHRMLDRAAQRLLAHEPSIATDNLYTAIVCGELDAVRRMLAERPEAAREAGGARGWTPILYAAYTRFNHPKTLANALDITRALLDAGANPNDFYMAGDARYSVLTGVAGEGEQDSPRQPYAAEMYQLLLERGAGPFDIQVLYDTHFSGDVLWWLEITHAFTRTGDHRSAWDDPDWKMLDMGGYGNGARFVLWIALTHRDLRLAEWALARGANPDPAPARARPFSKRSVYEDAVRDGFPEMAELLARHGAPRRDPALDDEERFVQACVRLDRAAARAAVAAHPEYLQSTKAMFLAADRDRPDVIALLIELGVPADIRDAKNTSALHHAAGANAVRAMQFLIDQGVEIDPRETNWGGAPIGWAAHGDRLDAIDLLSRYSRNVWTLTFRGYVDRVREILREDPSLARQVSTDGITPLWWLPDEEAKAAALVELLIAAGADPAARNQEGRTAADRARERGMFEIARRLEGP